jgi:hypothetical protein
VVALAGAAFASPESPRSAPVQIAPAVRPVSGPVASVPPTPSADETCLARTLCRLGPRLNGHRATWTPAFCDKLASGVVSAAARHSLSPALMLAVMINESDLNESAARLSHSHGHVAKDSGLMGIRCVLDRQGRCLNGLVRGMAWRQVMDPVTNVELGARYLALYRDGAGRSRITVSVRQDDGTVRLVSKEVPCRHRDHAYWAHYNHGTHFIAHGPASFYPQHVAALDRALGETLGLDTPELAVRGVMGGLQHQGGQRYVQLCSLIRNANPSCPAIPTLAQGSGLSGARL